MMTPQAAAPTSANMAGGQASPMHRYSAPTTIWAIDSSGALQRSFNRGRNWETVKVSGGPIPSAEGQTIIFRAVTSFDSQVWAGGDNAALYHSTDSGAQWTRVLPSSAGAAMAGNVESVNFSDAQHGTVTTSTPETWATSDGGQTWEKQ